MITIGLLGGIASGKSTVARLLAERGAVVLDADDRARQELNNPAVVEALRERWGDGVIAGGGDPSSATIDRQAVAALVFGNSSDSAANRRFLEQRIHPRVRQWVHDERRRLQQSGGPAVVLDIPLLLEGGYAAVCDHLLFVETPLEARQARAAGRGWSPAELAKREAAQQPLDSKRAAASLILANDGDEADLAAAVDQFWLQAIGPLGSATDG